MLDFVFDKRTSPCQAAPVRSDHGPRRPSQPRALRRRESLLDATARVLDREGWEALCTNKVAREAGASIGTLYDYFPDKRALLAGLLERHESRLAAALEEALVGAERDPLDAAGAAVDAFARVWTQEPGYRSAWLGTHMHALLDTTGARWSDRFTTLIQQKLVVLLPSLPEAEQGIVAHTAVHLVSGLLLAALASDPALRGARVAETRRALIAYLGSRLVEGERNPDP